MAQNTELEIKVIQRFINQSKQDRYIQFVRSTKNRGKFIADLNHFNILQAEAFEYVRGIEEEVVRAALQTQGLIGTTCYVISENPSIDTQTLTIDEALRMTVGHGMGTMLVFGNAEMAFYECETMNVRYISRPRR
ncbi:hypothetical protein [Hymenobacter chitinivorans]|uniref:Uncharacterized protein n=1 Tax=Hymenobacter chitinivorans DSM 11115 TaxID=1121954 RepID=A0A2M9BLA0_9BACT|nr:hypothetical protein [Hymenobacter chitinivorans]PJJ58724.1 hypothetical protein CLV45_0134 [Hymenobacter chitinivorans DSM 11115]